LQTPEATVNIPGIAKTFKYRITIYRICRFQELPNGDVEMGLFRALTSTVFSSARELARVY
jgi:hypothetical protein